MRRRTFMQLLGFLPFSRIVLAETSALSPKQSTVNTASCDLDSLYNDIERRGWSNCHLILLSKPFFNDNIEDLWINRNMDLCQVQFVGIKTFVTNSIRHGYKILNKEESVEYLDSLLYPILH